MKFRLSGLTAISAFVLLAAAGYVAAMLTENMQSWDGDAPFRELVSVADAFAETTQPTTTVRAWEAGTATSESDSGLAFDACENTGLSFQYNSGATGQFHLAETLGGGGAAADFDADGRYDLLFVDGGDPLSHRRGGGNRIHVFRQAGRGRFENVSEISGFDWSGYGHGCAAADIDNDGFPDLMVTGYNSVGLFKNQGDGTFVEVTTTAGIICDQWTATAAFGDLDQDGDLDLYVTGYADVPASAPTPVCEESGVRIHCHPHHWDPVPDMVFENLGDGTFADRSEDWGIADEAEYGLGVIIADVTNDGIPEVFVANDGDRNLLFQRTDRGTYVEVGIECGLAFNANGRSMGSMGIACSDFDGNGEFDLLTTNFIRERNVLFSNLGSGIFVDRSADTPLSTSSRQMVGWGAVPLDADHDTFVDLFVANGNVTDMPSAEYRQTPLLYRGHLTGALTAVSRPGDYFSESWHGRGAFTVDVAGDVRPDLVVCHIHDDPVILKNESVRNGNAVYLDLIGVTSNRDAWNAVVTARFGDRQTVHQLIQSAGYLCTSTKRLQITIGQADSIDELTVVWPSGLIQRLNKIPANTTWSLTEGRGRMESTTP